MLSRVVSNNLLILDKKQEIGQKIKDFGEKNFSSLAEFSRKLGMNNPQGITPYINGRSFPGFELLASLQKLGMDINLLLQSSGETQGSILREPNGATYMLNYKQLLEENKVLKETLQKRSVRIVNQDEIMEEMKQHIAKMQEDYDELERKYFELKGDTEPSAAKEIEKPGIYKMGKSTTS